MKIREKLDDILKEYINLFEEKHEVFFDYAVGDDLMGLLCFGDYLFTTRNIIYDIDNNLSQNLNFHLGNAVKYISRAGKKDPKKFREDLEKAIWYLNMELKKTK